MTAINKSALLATALLLSGIGVLNDAAVAKDKEPRRYTYKKDSGLGLGSMGGLLLHSYGYKDEQLSDGSWEVTGQARGNEAEGSLFIALYRAAEIAIEQKKPIIKLLSVNGQSLAAIVAGVTPGGGTFNGGSIGYGTRHTIEFALVSATDPSAHCADDVLRPSCRTIDASAIVREVGPRLKIK